MRTKQIRVAYKKSNSDQVAFCETFKSLLSGLVMYINNHAKTGVSWNPKGLDSVSLGMNSGQSTSVAASSSSAVQPTVAPPSHRPPVGGGGMGNIFGELSKGLNVTKGLKKVTKDQQTWRAEYAGKGEKVVEPKSPPQNEVAPTNRAAGSLKPKGPPIKEFMQQGNKWVVENQTSAEGVVTIEITDLKQIVYIYGSMGATIDIKGKCKMVTIDSCKKTQVLVDDAISAVEMVNCHGMKLQVTVARSPTYRLASFSLSPD